MSETTAILATLDEYASAYCAKDVDRLMTIFADGDDISLIGTGADELCAGRAEIRAVFERNFAEASATKFEWRWKQVTERGPCAVVAISLTIHLDLDGQPLKAPVRWTVSLIKRPGGWKWLHRHASSAAESQKAGAAYPTSDSNT